MIYNIKNLSKMLNKSFFFYKFSKLKTTLHLSKQSYDKKWFFEHDDLSFLSDLYTINTNYIRMFKHYNSTYSIYFQYSELFNK